MTPGRSTRRAVAAAAAVATLATGCGEAADRAQMPAALELLLSGRKPPAIDTFEVWVCRVPDTTTDPIYLSGGARLGFTSHDVAARFEASVPGYFADLSGGAYRPRFAAGGEVTLAPDADHQHCVDDALDRSTDAADAVFVVADAEHRGDRPGGAAAAGSGCACPARESRRYAYIGASDLHPGWGPTPAVDLVEHEIGHTLGLPHSTAEGATDAGTERRYPSALDVMSNSAAPRDVDPARRHGPATIAANLLALGWLGAASAHIVAEGGGDVVLTPSAVPTGGRSGDVRPRVALIALDDHRLLTVELLVPSGHDDHLPEAGVAVHRVDQRPAACGPADGAPCTGPDRRQIVLGSAAPHTDLLGAGEQLEVEGWRITVTSLGAEATVALRPTGG